MVPKATFGKQNFANSVETDNTPLHELHTQFKHKKGSQSTAFFS